MQTELYEEARENIPSMTLASGAADCMLSNHGRSNLNSDMPLLASYTAKYRARDERKYWWVL